MRLFVAVWPTPEVRAALAALPRRDETLRWTTPEQWHLTLRFLGEVPPDALRPLTRSLEVVAASEPPPVVRLGPVTERLRGKVLVVPAQGLDRLAAAVLAATATFGTRPDRGDFVGHLTLARPRRRGGTVGAAVAGDPVVGTWEARALSLVRSHGEPGGSRYEELASLALTGRADPAGGPAVRRRVVVTGRVQGVWFRESCRREAEAAGVRGSVRNRADGSVEAALEGDRGAVERVLAWMHHGPPRARVDQVRVVAEVPVGEQGFRVG